MHAFSSNANRVSAYGAIAVASVLIAIALSWLSNQLDLEPSWLVSAPTLAGVYSVIYLLVDKKLWRWKPLRHLGIIGDQPLDGVYVGKIVSNYNRKDLPVEITIDQTWTRILIQLDVLEPKISTSCSVAAACENLGNGQTRLTYTYRNNPNDGIADYDMNAHEGTVEVLIKLNGKANGRYFNSRGRKGTITLKRKP